MNVIFKQNYEFATFSFKRKISLKEYHSVLIDKMTPEIPQKGFSYLRI